MKRTTTEADLRDLIAQGKTNLEIATMLGRHPNAVSNACSVLGIRRQRGPVRIGGTNEEYLARLRCGKTVREVAQEFGVSHTAVALSLKRAGLPTSARQLLVAEAAKQLQAA